MTRWIIFISIYLILTFYSFQAIRTVSKSVWIYILFFIVSLGVIGLFLYQFFGGFRDMPPTKQYIFGGVIAMMVFMITILFFLFSEDVMRFFIGVYQKLIGGSSELSLPSRRKFVSSLALGVAAIPFLSLLYGMYRGKYNFKVLKYVLEFDDLPDAFDGYQLTQISDIHSGSFDNKEKIEYAIDLINEQESDVILFTGDMVNNTTSEMLPWKKTFSKLKAKDGLFSVLGNHDYGDYYQWESKEAKVKNLEDLKTLQKEMGFELLLNDSRFLERNGQRIAIVGVENWGNGFKQKGDLKLASEKVDKEDFKILMSHDPSHWEYKVIQDDYHYHLTLSGHTHGMQFGIEIPGLIKWSPVKWRYKYWAGIYQEMGQYLNVNRGFGYLAYPGRVGIWPEVTVITLKRRL